MYRSSCKNAACNMHIEWKPAALNEGLCGNAILPCASEHGNSGKCTSQYGCAEVSDPSQICWVLLGPTSSEKLELFWRLCKLQTWSLVPDRTSAMSGMRMHQEELRLPMFRKLESTTPKRLSNYKLSSSYSPSARH